MPSFLNAMTRQIPSSSIHAATQKAEAYRREGKKVVIFSIGRPTSIRPPTSRKPPRPRWTRIRALHPKHGHPAPAKPSPSIKRQTGVSYDPKTEVMITCGGQQAILLTMKAVLEPGDEVLLLSPGYGLYYNCAAIADAQVRLCAQGP
ncbi:MAG: aminotransferase class I/II-fold pyridoxal phosphate-dependent enzyme [Bilophila wadsworthia]